LRNPAYAPPVGPRGGRIAAGLAVPDRLRRDLVVHRSGAAQSGRRHRPACLACERTGRVAV